MMFLPCVGSILQQLAILLCIFLDLSVPWLYLPMGLYGIFGTYALFLMSLFSAYVRTPNTAELSVMTTTRSQKNKRKKVNSA